jgi:uncharacterized protein YlxW (UPF0749 family)
VDIQKKLAFITGALIFAFGVAEAIFIHWVGNVNWWIAWFISSASTSAIQIGMKVSENRKLFDLNDRELVRVSALANSLEEKVADLESEIEGLKADRD